MSDICHAQHNSTVHTMYEATITYRNPSWDDLTVSQYSRIRQGDDMYILLVLLVLLYA